MRALPPSRPPPPPPPTFPCFSYASIETAFLSWSDHRLCNLLYIIIYGLTDYGAICDGPVSSLQSRSSNGDFFFFFYLYSSLIQVITPQWGTVEANIKPPRGVLGKHILRPPPPPPRPWWEPRPIKGSLFLSQE